MKHLLIVFLGGTITLQWNVEHKKLACPTPEAKGTDLMNLITDDIVTEGVTAEFKVHSYKPSTEITDEDRTKLLDEIQHTPADAIIVVHGAKTIEQTAAFLMDKMPAGFTKRIGLVAANTPPCIEGNKEAYDNLEATYNRLQNVEDQDSNIFVCTENADVLEFTAERAAEVTERAQA